MKITLLTAAVVTSTILSASVAFAGESITMMTGSEKGSYNTIVCPSIQKLVAKDGINLTCQPSQGSGENFDAVIANGTTTVGLSQLDVYARKLSTAVELDEDAEEYMGNIGFMAPEALFCAAAKNGRIPQGAQGFNILVDDEAMDKPFVISTYGENSGSAGSVNFLRDSIPELKANTKMKYKKSLKYQVELGRLLAGKRDLVCFVSFANPEDSKIKSVIEDDNLFFVEFGSPELTNLKVGDMQAYQISDVAVTGSVWNLIGKGETLKTVTTGITLVMNVDEISSKAYDALVTAVTDPELLPNDTIVGKLARLQAKAKGATMDAYNKVSGKK